MSPRNRAVLRWALTIFMVAAGLNHFLNADAYEAMVPSALGAHALIVQLSGVAEVLGGLGLIVPATRRLAAWGLVALFVAVFPANINMAVNHLPLGTHELPTWALWGRLPIQILFVAWALLFTRRDA